MKIFRNKFLALVLVLCCSLFLMVGCGGDDNDQADTPINPDIPPIDNTVEETPVDDQGVHVYEEIQEKDKFADTDAYIAALDIFADAANNLKADLENSLKADNANAEEIKARLKKPFEQFVGADAPSEFRSAHLLYQEATDMICEYIDDVVDTNGTPTKDALYAEAISFISQANMIASNSLVSQNQ